MKLRSDDDRSFIEIFQTPGDPDHFTVRASFKDQVVENDYLYFGNVDAFMTNLSQLEDTRRGTAVLSGSEDFELALEPDGNTGALAIAISLHRHFMSGTSATGRARTAIISLQGTLTVRGEYVDQVCNGFDELFRRR